MLGQELQELELLVGEVERPTFQAGAVRRLVDRQGSDVDVLRSRVRAPGFAVYG